MLPSPSVKAYKEDNKWNFCINVSQQVKLEVVIIHTQGLVWITYVYPTTRKMHSRLKHIMLTLICMEQSTKYMTLTNPKESVLILLIMTSLVPHALQKEKYHQFWYQVKYLDKNNSLTCCIVFLSAKYLGPSYTKIQSSHFISWFSW